MHSSYSEASSLPRTALCDLLGCRHPVLLAGMGAFRAPSWWLR